MKHVISFLVPLMVAFSSCAYAVQDMPRPPVNNTDDVDAIELDSESAGAIGAIAFDRAITDLPIITSGEDFERIQRIMKRLVRSAARPDIGWRMVLVDSDIPDAWVMPDVKMAIYRGILNRLHDDQEVAAFLTHQMAHSLLGHNMFLLGRGEIQSVLMSQDTHSGGSIREQLAYNYGVSIADGIQVMPYSRMMESEADDLSMVMMLKAGYDPAAAIGTWQWLSDEGRFAMEYLSSHPSVSWRIEQMTEQMPCYHKAFKETWGHTPVGLEKQYRDNTVECPPFVTGLMSNIKRDHRRADNQNYMYDWDDEPGFEAAYYDHVRYNRYYYDDPYYNAWHRGRVSYSYGFRFGGFSYYRWSPIWSGWSFYDPWRPVYVFRIGRGYNHYADHPYRYKRKWSRHNVRFRDRHYKRHDYRRDEDRYRERRREYKDYGRKQRDGRFENRIRDKSVKSSDAEIRTQYEAKQRAVISNRAKIHSRGDKERKFNDRDFKAQVQPKRERTYRATSKNAKIKVPAKVRSNEGRKGVMRFREDAQKQPIRVERNRTSKKKTYSTPKRQSQPRVEREYTPYVPRKTNSAPRHKEVQQSRNARPKAQSQPKRQNSAPPRPKVQSTYKPKPKAQSQPKPQNYKPPKPPKADSSKSSKKFQRRNENRSHR